MDNSWDYQKARLQVAEACQDVGFAISSGKIKDQELISLMSECNPDYMEWDAIQSCQGIGIQAPECPVIQILIMDASLMRLSIP